MALDREAHRPTATNNTGGGGGGGGCPDASKGTPSQHGRERHGIVKTTWPDIESDTGVMTTLDSGHYLWTFKSAGVLTILT